MAPAHDGLGAWEHYDEELTEAVGTEPHLTGLSCSVGHPASDAFLLRCERSRVHRGLERSEGANAP